jgi:CheY-like chemotaxis protein
MAEQLLVMPRKAVEMKRRNILVADDEPSDVAQIPDALTRRGYTVITAGDAKEAVRAHAWHPEKIDLLVSDVAMAPMNGCELATLLLTAQRDLRVLLVSDRPSKEVIERQQAAPPCALFLRRPFTSDELLVKVSESLRDHHPSRILNAAGRPGFTALKVSWMAMVSKIRGLYRKTIGWRHALIFEEGRHDPKTIRSPRTYGRVPRLNA